MADQSDLEQIYNNAKSALKAGEYDRARDLLAGILAVDENYRDTSRLLAQSVRLKRRRWYNDRRLWGMLGVVLLIGLIIFLAPKAKDFYAFHSVPPTGSPTATLPPTDISTAPATLLPTPTPIPLTWKRISLGQDFQRDTVTAFATDKKDPDVIYAAMKNAGVYKTINGGLSWRPAHQGLASTQVESLFIDTQNPNVLYAGTMGGVFKSEDGGENWFRIGNGIYLLMDTKDNSHLYARDENGIYETLDQGNNWITVYTLKKNCPDAISSWAIHPADGKMLFLGGGETCAGVYQSNDNGHTWKLMGLKDKPNLNPLFIRPDEQGDFTIFTNFDSPIIAEWGIYVSYDGGVNWSHLGHDMACAILISDPDNPATIYCASDSLWVMRKKGDTWQLIPGTQSTVYSAVHIDHLNGRDRIIAGGTDVSKQSAPLVGIFISEDGGTSRIRQANGLGSTRVELKIDLTDSARIYLAAYYSGFGYLADCRLYRSIDSGRSWSSIKVEGDWCGPTFDAANVLYMKQLGSLQKSWNGGETWSWDRRADEMAPALPSYSKGGSQSVSANPYIEGVVYDVGDVIYYSTDTGLSWQLSTGSEGSWDARLFYTNQGKMIYAIGRYHQSYSVDSGKTWQSCGEDVTTSRSDSRLAIDLQSSRLYLATPGNGVLISIDNCRSWQASNNGLSNVFVNTLAVDPNNSDTVYAGTDSGAYVSFNGGQSWGQINDGLLGATVVYSIVVDPQSNVYAATPYGIFQLEKK